MNKPVFSKCKHWYFAAHSACYMLLKDQKLFCLLLPLLLFPPPTGNVSKKYVKVLEDHLQSLRDLQLEVHAPGRWPGCKAAGCKVNTFNLRNFSRRSSDSKKTIKSPIAGQEIYKVLSVESRRPLWLGVIPLRQGGPRRINPASCTAHTPSTTLCKETGLQYRPPQRAGRAVYIWQLWQHRNNRININPTT